MCLTILRNWRLKGYFAICNCWLAKTEFISKEHLADVNDTDTEESDHQVLVPESFIHNTPMSSDESPSKR